MLANENELAAKISEGHSAQISADEELDVVRELAALDREDNDPRIEPTLDQEIDFDALLSRAFEEAGGEKPESTDDASALSADELLELASFDDEPGVSVDGANTESAATDEAPKASLMEEMGETFGEEFKHPEAPAAEGGQENSPGANVQGLNAAASAAQEQLAADTLEGIKRAQAQGLGMHGDPQAQRVEVGLIQGMSMLSGAGLAGLTNMLRAGGATISNRVNTRKYEKLSGEIDTITRGMDEILGKFSADGLTAGMKGLKEEHRTELVKEFLAKPGNRKLFDDLVQSVGNLSTKATQAAMVGSAAGLSGDQLEIEIGRKIKDVSDKHKELLNSLHDHNGMKLSERLDNLVEKITDFLKQLVKNVAEALGYNQRPGM